jgi:hypothetical protein
MSAAMAIVPIDVDTELTERTLSVPEQAKTIRVADRSSYERACNFLMDVIAPMRREVEETFTPICQRTHEAHREATGQRSRHLKPLEDAERLLKQQIGAYELQKRREQEELERAAREAQELAIAESTEAAIEAAEAQGATREEVRAIIEQPVTMTRPVIEAPIQRVSGVSTRKTWRAAIVDIKALCRAVADGKVSSALVLPNEPALNALARAQGPDLARFCPGVRVYEQSSVAARRK